MKALLLTVALIFSANVMSQESWSDQERDILEKYGLQVDDPRGIILRSSGSSCAGAYHENIESAIESFLTTTLKKDLTEYCVEALPKELDGIAMDIHQIIRVYLNN